MEENEEVANQQEQSTKSQVFPSNIFCGPLLLICMPAVLLFYSIAVTLGMITAMSDSYINIKNHKNVVYTDTSGGAGSQKSILMIPGYSINIGMLYFTIGPSYFSRKTWNLIPLNPLLNATNTIDPLLPELIRDAFVKVRSDALQLGFASAETCGGISADSVMGRSNFVVAALVIAIIFLAGVVSVGAYFFVILTKPIAQFGGHVSTCWARKEVELYGGERELITTAIVLRERQRMERILIIIMTVFGIIGTVFFMMAFAIMQNMFSSTLKCQRPFCDTYNLAMEQLFVLLPSGGYTFSCNTGTSSRTLLTGIIMAFLGVAFLLLILGIHVVVSCSKFKLLKPSAGRHIPPDENTLRNPMRSDMPSPSSLDSKQEVTESYSWLESVPSRLQLRRSVEVAPHSREYIELSLQCILGETQKGVELEKKYLGDQNEEQEESILIRAEESKRTILYSEENLEFRAKFRWIKRKLWYGEFMRLLHLQSLNLYFAPLLDLHAEETFCRQHLWINSCSKLQKKLRDLKSNAVHCGYFRKYINSVISEVELTKEEGLDLASHYNPEDGIYKYNVPTDEWLRAADITPTSMEKGDGAFDSADAKKSLELLYSPISVNVSSTESFEEDNPVRLSPLEDLINIPSSSKVSFSNDYFEEKYADLVQKAQRTSRLTQKNFHGLVNGYDYIYRDPSVFANGFSASCSESLYRHC
ncbi:uncharacterized protein TM35_000024360 [Trypanosoma theileri]|uniref:Uncharacterized protein n=1 Tax=Trypanosoma theileri TaxID=67003 RepID=A0A1X0P9H9_9TRYP|nr:uncharacterized protein TM35_000024360 [Trypanosoma theileri]ORC93110.1 hypothetical protein TM35_000024360 [Trypanosoma theileri]